MNNRRTTHYYAEHSVVNNRLYQQPQAVYNIKSVLVLLKIVLVLCILAIVVLLFVVINMREAMLVLGMSMPILAVLIFFLIVTVMRQKRLLTRYTYIVSDGRLEIVSNNKTKTVIVSLPLLSLEALGKVSDERFAQFLRLSGIKIVRATCNNDKNNFGYIYAMHNSKKYLIILEPSQDILITIKRSCPKVVVGY